MSRLKGVQPEEATGMIAQTYQRYSQVFGKVPNVFKFHTASENIYGIMTQYFQFLGEHKTLGREFFAYLRLIVSFRKEGEYCVNLNSSILESEGISKENLKAAIESPDKAKLPKKEIALLKLALKVTFDAEKVEDSDIETLHDMGWTDKEIYEASYAASFQMAMTQMIKAFKVVPDYPGLY